MKRKDYLLLVIILLAFLLRIYGINRPLFGDEIDWARSVDTLVRGKDNFILQLQPPTAVLIYSAFSLFYANLRVVPLVFGMLTLVLTYLIAKKLDKKTAILSLVFISFSYYHILASQLVDMDGGILTFLIFLSYFLLFNEEYGFSALFFLAACLTRPTFVMFIIPIGYYLMKSRKLKHGMPYIVAIIALLPAWLLLDSLTFPTFYTTIQHYLSYASTDLKSIVVYKLLNGARIVTRITPPAVFALLASFYLMQKEKSATLRMLSVHILMSFLFFVVTNGGDQVRYFSVAIPAISVIISYFASKELFRMRAWELAIAPLAYLAVLFAMDFNEVNLLLLPLLLLVTFILVVPYKSLKRITAICFILSIVFSLFMLYGIRTDDELRSYAVSDILMQLSRLGVERVVVLQERGVWYYLEGDSGKSKFVSTADQFNSAAGMGGYVVNEPMMPSNLPTYVKSLFWRAGWRDILMGKCSTVYEKDMHGIIVDEIYVCPPGVKV